MSRLCAAVFAAWATLAVAACTSTTAGHPAALPLRIGLTAEPNSLSPLLALNDYEQLVDRLLFDVLVTVDPHGRSVPRLAAVVPTLRNGGVSRDGRTLTYHLRHDVVWHDGVPFTSKDVAFSYRAIMNPANNVPSRHGYDLIASVATPDRYTVIFHMKRPYGPAVTTLFSDAEPSPILPEHILGREPSLNRVPFNDHPIGTGPYSFIRWSRSDSIELAANDKYYLGRPKIARLSVRFIPDESSMINLVRTHEIDLFTEASVNGYAQLKTIPNVVARLSDAHAAANVLLNNTRPQLRDVRVRQAIAAAIDKASIVKKYISGAGTVATADLPSFMWANDPHLHVIAYDPAHARALLRAAGWVPGPDGIVTREGRRLALEFAYAQNNITSRLIVVGIQAYLRAVGIDVSVKGYSTQQMFAGYGAGGIYQSGNFDLAWYTMTLGIDPDSSGRFTCGAFPPHGQNYSRYCSAEMDAAQNAGLDTLDEARRKVAYARSQELLVRDVPIVFVFWPKNVDAYDARLKGFDPNPVTPTWNAQEWSFR
jgi:peptide/nickel transport system substrate-binding protein